MYNPLARGNRPLLIDRKGYIAGECVINNFEAEVGWVNGDQCVPHDRPRTTRFGSANARCRERPCFRRSTVILRPLVLTFSSL